MLIEQTVLPRVTKARNPWIEPFAESRILAGFLKPDDVPVVYPASQEWPEDVHAHVRSLCGAAAAAPPQPNAGKCRLHPVEEAEALAVLHQMTQGFQAPPGSPVSYAWVEIENLIASLAVSPPFLRQVAAFGSNLEFLAEYSLYGPPPMPIPGAGGALYTLTAARPTLVQQGMEDGLIVCRYQFVRVPQPILVGYEKGRFYLLNEYGRVIEAMVGKVDRLLCLVHYGLDLNAAKMGLKGIEPQGGIANHFGQTLLSGERPPMVKDFLNSRLTAVVPSRAAFYVSQPAIHTTAVNFTPHPSDQLPLQVNESA